MSEEKKQTEILEKGLSEKRQNSLSENLSQPSGSLSKKK